MQLSHELRPGARSWRGPVELWQRFDAAVAELGEALEGAALSAIARAFGELSEAAREIERIDSHIPPQRGDGEMPSGVLIASDERSTPSGEHKLGHVYRCECGHVLRVQWRPPSVL